MVRRRAGLKALLTEISALKGYILKKNRNFFDFLSHGVEIRFSNFHLGHFGKVEAVPSQNGTLDEIDNSTPSGDNSTPSGATYSALGPTVFEL